MEKHNLSWSDLTKPLFRGMTQAAPMDKTVRERRHNPGRAWGGYCRRHKPMAGPRFTCLA